MFIDIVSNTLARSLKPTELNNWNKVSILLQLTMLLLFVPKAQAQYVKKITESNRVLIRNVNALVGDQLTLQPGVDVLIEGGTITKIDTSIHLPGIKPSEIIEANGQYLCPGLIDSHVHLSGNGSVPWKNVKVDIEANLERYLSAGVTTVYDLGGLGKKLEKLGKNVSSGKITGPDVFHAHIPITVENSHPIPLTEQMLPWPLKRMVNVISPVIADSSGAQKLIEDYIKQEVDFVKIICDQIPPGSPQMNEIQMRALVIESHKNGLKVIAHIGSPDNAVAAVNAGVDALAHGIWRGKLTESQARIIAAAKIPVIYTMAGFVNVSSINRGEFQADSLTTLLAHPKVIESVAGENGKDVHDHAVFNEFFNDVELQSQYWDHNFKLLMDYKVVILVGTDSSLPGTYAGGTMHQEMALLKQHGLSNYDVLQAATVLNAQLFKSDPEFGQIKEGYEADLILLPSNPLMDLKVLASPVQVVVNGRVYQPLR